MARVTMIHHVNIQAKDRTRARDWYERVLGARFRDRGRALNEGQMQLNLGDAEVHFSDTPDPIIAPRVHFAVEVDNWEEMVAHLDAEGVEQYPNTRSLYAGDRGNAPRHGKRKDSGENFTFISDPDGNVIEIIHHPYGLEDTEGNKVEIPTRPSGLQWTFVPDFKPS